MSFPIDYKYPLDVTGTAITNYIGGELHILDSDSSQLVVFRSGAFFTKSIRIYDWVTEVDLVEDTDYKFRCFYKEATLACNAEIATVIEFTDPTRVGSYGISGQVVGGEFSYNNAIIIGLLLDLIEDNRNVDWDEIKNMPILWDPSYHMHLADTDIYGTGGMTKGMERIEEAIQLRNVSAITDPIMAEVATKVSRKVDLKIGMENSVYRPFDPMTSLVRLTLPKSTIGNARCTVVIQVKEQHAVSEFTITFTEKGREYEDMVISRSGNSEIFWAVKLSTYYISGNSIDFVTNWIREPHLIVETTFTVLSYSVDTRVSENTIVIPVWTEYTALPNGWSDADICYPVVDKRDYVTRNRNTMLQAPRPYLRFDMGTVAEDTFNNAGKSLFAVKFPKLSPGTGFSFTMAVDVTITSGNADHGVFRYYLTGKYFSTNKFKLDDVSVDGQVVNPLEVSVAGKWDDDESNFFLFSTRDRVEGVIGSAAIASMEVTTYSRKDWIEDWGLVDVLVDITDANKSVLNYRHYMSNNYDLNQHANIQKVLFRNAIFSPLALANGKGIKLEVPALQSMIAANYNQPKYGRGEVDGLDVSPLAYGPESRNPNSEVLIISLFVSTRKSASKRTADEYTITYSNTRSDITVTRVGNSDNELHFGVSGDGMLHMHGLTDWNETTLWVKAITTATDKPERFKSDLMWFYRSDADQSMNAGLRRTQETTTPDLLKYLDDHVERIDQAISDLSAELAR